jgi:hypothetical protein
MEVTPEKFYITPGVTSNTYSMKRAYIQGRDRKQREFVKKCSCVWK